MAAEDLKLSDDIEAELHPHVVIVANDSEKYAKFASHLEKNGFPCQVFTALPAELAESPRQGTIFFTSFNLRLADPIATARAVEQKLNMVCIVFAELEGFETAAKLSSAKMSQTLQFPYTEKNFLMAVQTIVKKRTVQHEKNLRKLSVLERRKGALGDAAAAQSGPDEKVFKGEAAEPEQTAIVIQKGNRGEAFFETQKGFLSEAKFFFIAPGERQTNARYLQQTARAVERARVMKGEDAREKAKHVTGSAGQVSATHAKGKVDASGSTHAKGGASVTDLNHARGGGLAKTEMNHAKGGSLEKNPATHATGAASKTEVSHAQGGSSEKGAANHAAGPAAKTAHNHAQGGAPEKAQATHATGPAAKVAIDHAKGGITEKAPAAHADGGTATETPAHAKGAAAAEEKVMAKGAVQLNEENAMARGSEDEAVVASHVKGAAPSEDLAIKLASPTAAAQKAKSYEEGGVLQGYDQSDVDQTRERAKRVPKGEPKAPENIQDHKTQISGDLSVPTWVLMVTAVAGIAFCLFFLYTMIKG